MVRMVLMAAIRGWLMIVSTGTGIVLMGLMRVSKTTKEASCWVVPVLIRRRYGDRQCW